MLMKYYYYKVRVKIQPHLAPKKFKLKVYSLVDVCVVDDSAILTRFANQITRSPDLSLQLRVNVAFFQNVNKPTQGWVKF